jgi:hypothetical protein
MKPIEELASLFNIDLKHPSTLYIDGLTNQQNQWIDLCCQLAGISDWRFLLRIKNAILFILHQCLKQLKITKLEQNNAISQTMDVFDFLGNEYYRRHHASKRKVLPTPPSFRTATPRYAFLVSADPDYRKAYINEVDTDNLSATYKSIASEVITGLIAIENQIPVTAIDKSKLLANISWSARLLISQIPDLADTSLKEIVEIRTDAIVAFAERHSFLTSSRGYRHSYSGEEIERLAGRFIERHLNNLNLLLTRQVKIVRPRKPLLSRSQKAWLKRKRGGEESTGSHVSTTSLSFRKLRDAAELGIAPSELEAEFLDGVRPGGYLHHKISSAMIYRYEEATAWSREVPGFSILGQIYRNAFSENWEQMTSDHRLAAFRLMVHLHVGILPELLNPIKVGNRHNGRRLLIKDGIYLDIDKTTFVHLVPVQLDPQTLLASSSWKNRGIVEVPLPDLLEQMLEDLLKDFPPPKSGERWIPAGTEIPQLLPKGISTLKLIDAFERYYAIHYGCEPEIMSLVAGMPSLRSEPPRDCRRPQSLRGWGHGTRQEISQRGEGAGGSAGG